MKEKRMEIAREYEQGNLWSLVEKYNIAPMDVYLGLEELKGNNNPKESLIELWVLMLDNVKQEFLMDISQ